MKKVIVTGGYGFIGSNLIKYLLKKKYFVINIDKLSYSSNSYNLKNIRTNNYVFIKFIQIKNIFKNFFVIFIHSKIWIGKLNNIHV